MTHVLASLPDLSSTELTNSYFDESPNFFSTDKSSSNSLKWGKSYNIDDLSLTLKDTISTPHQKVHEIQEDSNDSDLTKEQMKDNTFSDNYFSSAIEIDLPEINTVPDETLTKPVNDLFTKTKKELDKAVRSLLGQKVLYFEKQLECYGVIDHIYLDKNTRLIDARIYNINTNKIMDNITFEANEFPKQDQNLLIENAVFYWRVGKDHNLFGGHRKVSEFRLRRRVIKLSPTQLKKKEQDINDTINFFESVFNKKP